MPSQAKLLFTRSSAAAFQAALGRELALVLRLPVPREELAPFFGKAVYAEGAAYVREDLPPRVKRFTIAHELYHLGDTCWDGPRRRELRANLVPALRDPLGLLACLWASCTRERLALYWDRVRRGY